MFCISTSLLDRASKNLMALTPKEHLVYTVALYICLFLSFLRRAAEAGGGGGRPYIKSFGSMFSHRHITMPCHRFSCLLDTSLYCIRQHYPAVKAAADRFWKNRDWKTGRLGKRDTSHKNECMWFWTFHISCTNLRGGGKSTRATRSSK